MSAPTPAERGPCYPFNTEEQDAFADAIVVVPNALSTGDIILASGDPAFWRTLKFIFGPLVIIIVLRGDETEAEIAAIVERLRVAPTIVPLFVTVLYRPEFPERSSLLESAFDGIIQAVSPTQANVEKLRDHDADDKELIIEGQRVSIVAKALEAFTEDRQNNDVH